MDLLRYIEQMQAYKEAYGCYPPTWEEVRRARRAALERQALEIEAEREGEQTLHPPIPRPGRRKYWK